MAHTAETLLPRKEYCHDLNHSEMVHISRAKMVCKMHTPMYLFDGWVNVYFSAHYLSLKFRLIIQQTDGVSAQLVKPSIYFFKISIFFELFRRQTMHWHKL